MSEETENKVGRPTKYDPKYCEEIVAFMERTSHEVVVDRTFYGNGSVDTTFKRKDGDGFVRWMVKGETHKLIANTFPTLERFCHEIGVHKDTVISWATATYAEDDGDGHEKWDLIHPEFSDAYKRAKQIQEAILVENALNGTYTPNFSVFVAKNAFGWKDKSETELTGKDGTPLASAVIYLPDNKRTADAGTE